MKIRWLTEMRSMSLPNIRLAPYLQVKMCVAKHVQSERLYKTPFRRLGHKLTINKLKNC